MIYAEHFDHLEVKGTKIYCKAFQSNWLSHV